MGEKSSREEIGEEREGGEGGREGRGKQWRREKLFGNVVKGFQRKKVVCQQFLCNVHF